MVREGRGGYDPWVHQEGSKGYEGRGGRGCESGSLTGGVGRGVWVLRGGRDGGWWYGWESSLRRGGLGASFMCWNALWLWRWVAFEGESLCIGVGGAFCQLFSGVFMIPSLANMSFSRELTFYLQSVQFFDGFSL